MKKKLFLRLCLMFLISVSAFSCRTEEFHNEEETHGSTGLRLTSQRISLNEAKHRTKLLPDLEKAETAIEKKALKVQGKSVNIGNEITIDTDEVIYIENGPDYHTYTFSVIRDNASANAPVENILMTPNTDGSYRVFHIVLNLTEADKVKIANREYVDYKNKQQVTELAGINLSSLTQKQICVPHYFSYPVSCKEGLHEPGQPCAYAGTSGAAYWGSIVLYDCFGEEPETIMPTPMPIDGGGGGGGTSPEEGEGQNPPYECTSAATDPTQVGLVSPTGCFIGMPSEPIVRPTQTPCEKIKAQNSNITYKSKVDFLKGKTNETFEYGFRVGNPIVGSGQTEVQYQQLSNVVGSQTLDFKIFNNTFAMMHSHHENLVPVFSPDDINSFIKLLINASNNGIPLSSVYLTLVNPDGTVYQLWGSNEIDVSSLTVFDQNLINKTLNKIYTGKDYQLNKANQSPQFYQENFLKFMKEYMNVEGAKMYSIDDNGKGSLISLNGNSLATPFPCPN
ncbi:MULTISPECIES: hypothetical protein [Chryseobacterium]|uniref:Uncharacterized protein n=1 Tax=Chryseobacterium taihuense TaxID=1141221 RepID=A0A4U8WG44_9FLAO|nr:MULTISPECIES: hypothetical protein [Chryseobacterium]QQV02046.1 hypothetical protein I6I61_13310 [Chryseobacterium sp. FDAARGOS 1104]VFB04726.1 Uncharacterised protein [Chryseobacterium taihuense]